MAKRKAEWKNRDDDEEGSGVLDDKEEEAELPKDGDTGFKTERIMKKWIQRGFGLGDTDTTIWAGLDGVGDSG